MIETLKCGEGSADPPKLLGGWTWKENGVKYLGVYIGDDATLQTKQKNKQNKKKQVRCFRKNKRNVRKMKMAFAKNVLLVDLWKNYKPL